MFHTQYLKMFQIKMKGSVENIVTFDLQTVHGNVWREVN